ncbi:MAG: hypothetical protein U9N34_04715 [Candidatus Cloacimonadota bacterium]|nr:hypothetical protein [Candidatus Cloacimonadota bacterium]
MNNELFFFFVVANINNFKSYFFNIYTKEALEDIYREYSEIYGFERSTVEAIVLKALSYTYGGIGNPIINDNGSMLITYEEKGFLKPKNVVVSEKQKKKFQNIFVSMVEKHQKTILKDILLRKLEENNNILYAKALRMKDGIVTFQMYDRSKNPITNLYGNSHIDELLQIDYSKDDIVIIVKPFKRINLQSKDGKYSIQIRNKDTAVLEIYLKIILKKLNKSITESYAFEYINFNKENNTAAIFLKNKTITKSSSSYIAEKMLEYTGVKVAVLIK